MIVHEKNPICLTLCYELEGKEETYMIENTGLAFTIIYHTFLKYGGEYCVKRWISPEAEFINVWIDAQIEDGQIYTI